MIPVLGLKSKNSPTEEPTYIVVQRGPFGQRETAATRDEAFEAFSACLSTGYFAAGTRRRIFVTGPDYCIQDDDPSDPLLIGPAALHAVLTPTEYAALVQAPVAAAFLES